ncbi:YfcE family phosphodiesterase [Sulfurimonas sp.]|uniref:YfcE family phosphodiesterase n=1 Tax=Sulfurimonas sp. TaxID=2022749 RepID=UPI0025FCB786|nr:YfcE family phosphodiesterase [Sulfurimonas sp.]MCK9472550.1 YfcE family phosphodiesterase [Sulfurimonas sp.]
MKIGIIADTHTKVKKARRAIDSLMADGAEFMLHAGDIVDVEVLHLLHKSGIRYEAVYGNNDAHLAKFHDEFNLVQEPYYFKLANTKFKLMHLPFYMTPDTDVIIFAHTHEFFIEFVNNTLFLNPGEVCARNKPLSEWAMLEIKESEFILTRYTRANKSDEIKKEEFRHTRQTP